MLRRAPAGTRARARRRDRRHRAHGAWRVGIGPDAPVYNVNGWGTQDVSAARRGRSRPRRSQWSHCPCGTPAAARFGSDQASRRAADSGRWRRWKRAGAEMVNDMRSVPYAETEPTNLNGSFCQCEVPIARKAQSAPRIYSAAFVGVDVRAVVDRQHAWHRHRPPSRKLRC